MPFINVMTNSEIKDKDINMVFENHATGIFVRDFVVIL